MKDKQAFYSFVFLKNTSRTFISLTNISCKDYVAR